MYYFHKYGINMAGGSLLMLLDDITTMLDDVSVMTKVAAKKTAGVLGDDLALNAQQVAGVDASRELPVVWAVAKGSAINKAILVPTALLLSIASKEFNIPWLITGLLMIGGAFLCFEGFEKIAHKLFHGKDEDAHEAEIKEAIEDPKVDLVALEKDKIKGAIRTDFILSAEIIVIALGTVANQPISKEIGVLIGISVVMTIGVYGLVAAIVKLDDVGLYMMMRKGQNILTQFIRKVGSWLLAGTPYLMRALSILGTAAMFLVGGSIIAHGIPALHHLVEPLKEISFILPMLVDGVVGILVGAICVALYTLVSKFLPKKTH
jgi:predicted DNA repair protein MutK